MKNKINTKAIYLVSGLVLAAIGGFLLFKHLKKQKEEKESEKKTSGGTKISVTTDNSPINAGTINPAESVIVQNAGKPNTNKPVVATGKETDINKLVGDVSKQLQNKMLVAKYNGSGIYDANLNKVAVTKQGNHLGYAINAQKATNGSYTIKYRDEKGNLRVVNSVAVRVLI